MALLACVAKAGLVITQIVSTSGLETTALWMMSAIQFFMQLSMAPTSVWLTYGAQVFYPRYCCLATFIHYLHSYLM